ncbi:5'-methylthioadenosine/S-adenosylhomocysteine nucleosidase [Bacteroides sp. 519]|uniref:5'-methylthioadenosine/S-adenosylhomocysteine nucleosidase family protein n=1 Tax=Bacteroides sp. 519 TaxID=2302937 RepID=UPI0013D12896|nr:5'-methylthioadenosine/S-adenosylhomocysteine nucleosidase [Bacteroides sp. 519]NDV60777.1 nucleosidase [Bacteroides sp. 519]
MNTIIITYAVNQEFTPITIDGWNIKYVITGVGKAKSAMRLTEAVILFKPDFVLNIGTAGTLAHNVGDTFICNKFIDRDYQSTQLPGLEYEIGETDIKYKTLTTWLCDKQNKVGTCSTGDTFITEVAAFHEDVIDMEAYAQALVCKEFNIPFIAVKYVTDIVGQNSVKHWEDKLSDARKHLTEWVKKNLPASSEPTLLFA